METFKTSTHISRVGHSVRNSCSTRPVLHPIFTFLFIAFVFSIITSCSFEGAATPTGIDTSNTPAASNIVYFTGTVDSNGALPADVSNDLESAVSAISSGSIASSAFPSINTTEYEYFAQATYDGLNSPVEGDFASGSSTFTIALEIGPSWSITAGIRKKSGHTVVMQSEPYTPSPVLSATNPVMTHTFTAVPVEGGSGKIELDMTVASSVYSVESTCSNNTAWQEALTAGKLTVNTSGITTGSAETDTIPAGTYEVTLNFYDSAAPTGDNPDTRVLLYTTTQTINVFAGMTTNKWRSGSSVSGSLIDNTDGTFNLTSTIISSFSRTLFYVGQTSAATSVNINASDENPGSAYAPLATLARALDIIRQTNNSSTDYIIFVTGTYTGNFEIPSTITTSMANSITIKGTKSLASGVPQDILTANNSGTVLTVETAVPVTIENLKITGGNTTGNGGGIKINNSNAKLYLANGALVTGNQATHGGGVFLESGSLFIYGTAVVGKAGVTSPAADGTGTYGNKAVSTGGGVGVGSGTLWLGYSAENVPATTSGGVIYNLVKDSTETHGGGIDNKTGTINIARGNVSYNCATSSDAVGCGGGISTARTLKISGSAVIEGNVSAYGGGVYLTRDTYNGSLEMTGGTIKSNRAVVENDTRGDGGGVAVTNNASFTMSGGTITSNTSEGKGGAVTMLDGRAFNIKGSPSIPYGVNGTTGAGKNDVYLGSGKKINITGALNLPAAANGKVATITLDEYVTGLQLLTLDSSPSPSTTLADEYSKFALADESNVNVKSSGYTGYSETITTFYVRATGSDSNNGKTADTAYQTIGKALKRITGQCSVEDYTINIVGELTGAQVIPASDTSNNIAINAQTAKSITLCGEGLGAELDGGFTSSSNGTTLTISTAQPVTIENLTITGGFAENYGGGLYIETNANVVISEGANIIQNTANNYGGGIYTKGTLALSGGIVNKNYAHAGGGIFIDGGKVLIYGNAMIGEDAAGLAENQRIATAESYGNLADSYGGGIYVNGGILALGYSSYTSADENYPEEFTGKICRNYTRNGGGIAGPGGTVVFASGTISYNAASEDSGGMNINGAGGDGCNFTMTGGSIEHNSAPCGGGICITQEPHVTIEGGSISYNTATDSSKGGGGIYIKKASAYTTTLNLYGGTISNNTADNGGSGGAIYVDDGNKFNIKGSVYVPYGVGGAEGTGKNDLYLEDGMSVTIAGKLTPPSECTNGVIATIKPQTYSTETTVLTLSTSPAPNPTTTLKASCNKFSVIPEDLGGGTTEDWFVSVNGKLTKTETYVPATTSAATISEKMDDPNVTKLEAVFESDFGCKAPDIPDEQKSGSTYYYWNNSSSKWEIDYSCIVPAGKTLELRADTPVTIKSDSNYYFFKVYGTLIIGENVTVTGTGISRSVIHGHLMDIENGGKLILNGGTITNGVGGGTIIPAIDIKSGGTFIMNSGLMTGTTRCGTVRVGSGAIFEMNGGEISGNNTDSTNQAAGVTVKNNGTFIKTGGTIKNNTRNFSDGSQLYIESGGKYGTSESTLTTYSDVFEISDEF